MPGPEIRVVGLKEFHKRLRETDRDLGRQLTKVNKYVAGMLADATRPALPEASGALRRSLRPGATGKTARVTMGGARAPYAPWIEFGGTIAPRGTPIKRERVPSGRYLYRALAEHRDRLVDAYFDEVSAMLRRNDLI